jgi:phage-related protein
LVSTSVNRKKKQSKPTNLGKRFNKNRLAIHVKHDGVVDLTKFIGESSGQRRFTWFATGRRGLLSDSHHWRVLTRFEPSEMKLKRGTTPPP